MLDHPPTLAAALLRTARRFPLHGVGYLGTGSQPQIQSYPGLLEDAARVLTGLRDAGLRPGDPVLLQLPDNRDFITGFWACELGGYVPVPLSPIRDEAESAAPVRKLIGAWGLLDRPATLASSSAMPVVERTANRENAGGFKVLSIGDMQQGEPASRFHEPQPDDLALLLLTSGSTGKPKAVRQTHRTLLAWAVSASSACEFTSADISLNWMPLDHVGGIVMFHLRDLVAGCRQFHAPTEAVLRHPLSWLDWIESTRASITWAPNFAFGVVNEHADQIAAQRWDLSTMRFILNGGEAIVSKTARRFLELLIPHGLPQSAMRPAWGMSETCSGVTYSRFMLAETSDADPFVSVGRPIPGIEIRIVDADDRPIAEGTMGRLQIRGISVTPGYHGDPEATRAAFTKDGWFITGDLGVVLSGELTIAGREKDVIIVNGANYYCHEIEAIAEEVAGVEVSFTAACAVRPGGEDSDRVAIFFVPSVDVGSGLAKLVREIRRTVTLRAGVTPDFVVPLPVSEIPKTAIGKIQRNELRRRFERGDFAEMAPCKGSLGAPLRVVWRAASGLARNKLPAGSKIAVMAESGGLGDTLIARLDAAGYQTILIRAGIGFAQEASGRFTVKLDNPADYARLFETLNRAGSIPTHLVHALALETWPEPTTEAALLAAQIAGSISLLHLVRAAEQAKIAAKLLLLTSGTLATEDDRNVEIAKSPLIGLARTIAHESDTLALTHLDLASSASVADIDLLAAELGKAAGGSIAIRVGGSLIPVLEAVPAHEPPGAEGLKPGLYLISGGNGALGRSLAARLVGQHGARVALLGRHPTPARATLADLGESAIYLAGDITDPEFVRAALAESVARWGLPLRGIFHLAGTYHEAPIASETAEGLIETIRPKLAGALALHRIARGHPECIFVSFSSLLGHFGAFGTGAYAAANAALDAFSAFQRSQGVRAYSIAWSMWDGLGMARLTHPETSKRRGFEVLPPDTALDRLEQMLAMPAGHYLIGVDRIDGTKSPPPPREALAEKFVAPEGGLEAQVAQMWRDLLNLDAVSTNVSFFDLGGSSLLAARLFARIENESRTVLPIATLFSHPTIAELAQAIRAAPSRTTMAGILTRLSHGAGQPLFCISGVGSDVIAFRELADALGDGLSCYGLQAPGLDGTPIEGEAPTLESVAGHFIHAMREVQPSGPYRIAGHCFGSLLAWEVARQLCQQRMEVGLLALLDPVVSTEFPEQMMRHDLVRYSMRKFLRLSMAARMRFVWEKAMNVRRFILVRRRIGRSIDTARDMYGRYRLQPYPGDAIVFLASDSFFELATDRDPRRHFQSLAEGGVSYIRITGDHDSMLRQPGVTELAARLQAALYPTRPDEPAPTLELASAVS